MADIYDDDCDARQIIDECQVPRVLRKPYIRFYIKIMAEFIYSSANEVEEEEEEEDDDENLDFANRSADFWEPADKMIGDQAWPTIQSMLSTVGVPLERQEFMVRRIAAVAREIAAAERNVGRKVLPMVVDVSVIMGEGDSMSVESDEELRVVPADKKAVAALERVVARKDTGKCVVCFEDMKVGSGIRRMPCLHVFHGRCIANWLGNSNFCPLCRFKLTAAIDEA